MRSIYLQHSKNSSYDLKQQIKQLNKLVLDYCVPNIFTNIDQYKGYAEKISNPHVPLPRSIDTSITGKKQTF